MHRGWWSTVFTGMKVNMTLDKGDGSVRKFPGLYHSESAVLGSGGVRVLMLPDYGIEFAFPASEGFNVPPRIAASFAVRPRQVKRMKPPYGQCSDKNSLLKVNYTGKLYVFISPWTVMVFY